jgi:phosphomannomutase/phosphoglucomutase
VIDLLEPHLPFEFIKLQHEPDGSFPNGVPNPMLPEGRPVTQDAIRQHGADFGVAWDGDFDRCFLFDHNGRFIEGYYIVGLLAVQLLKQNPGALIVHDPRLTWNTRELVEQNRGQPVLSKAGHAFIKETMREVNAVYGGEMSAHHYFRDFGFCDSGMIPWLLLAQMMSDQNKSLADLVDEGIESFPVSGEINVAVDNPWAIIESVKAHFGRHKHSIEEIDGLSMDFGNWRFNLRPSNTEPLLRMNMETRGDYQLMEQKRDELLELIHR